MNKTTIFFMMVLGAEKLHIKVNYDTTMTFCL